LDAIFTWKYVPSLGIFAVLLPRLPSLYLSRAFPFAVFYLEEAGLIWILAVLALKNGAGLLEMRHV